MEEDIPWVPQCSNRPTSSGRLRETRSVRPMVARMTARKARAGE